MSTSKPMPAAFIGHGSPMNTLEENRYTSAWRAFGRALPRPRAVLCVSAHWYVHGTAVTAMPNPRVIHDFYGFPPALFAFDYPAPGAPDVAHEVAEVLKPAHCGLDLDSWGIDHGTWSVLAHVFPKADIPVLQLSLHAGQGADYHLALGERLAPLRARGVFILGSGNIVHNLRRIEFSKPDSAFDWGLRFDEAVHARMTTDPSSLPEVARHPDYALSVPTDEHFLPLYYFAGLCHAAREPARAFVSGCTMGSISMTSYVLGAEAPRGSRDATEGAAPLPDPRVVPPEDTNT